PVRLPVTLQRPPAASPPSLHLYPHLFLSLTPRPPTSTLFPYTTLFRSSPPGRRARASLPGGTSPGHPRPWDRAKASARVPGRRRSEVDTAELQSLTNVAGRVLLATEHSTRADDVPRTLSARACLPHPSL